MMKVLATIGKALLTVLKFLVSKWVSIFIMTCIGLLFLYSLITGKQVGQW